MNPLCRYIPSLLGTLIMVGTVNAGPPAWLDRLFSRTHGQAGKPLAAALQEEPLTLKLDVEKRLRYVPATPAAALSTGQVHYQRFMLDEAVPRAQISLRLLADRHDQVPRFTVFSAQLVILDTDGQVSRIVPLDHLRLDIRPFQPTQLRECIVVSKLRSFLLASDPARLGKQYEFNARLTADSVPDHGFYRVNSPMKVFLPYAVTGTVSVRVTPAPKQVSACQLVPE